MKHQSRPVIGLTIGAVALLTAGLTAGTASANEAEFAYSGDEGPAYWYETEGWETCAGDGSSARQSPINVNRIRTDESLRRLAIDAYPIEVNLFNNGATIEQEYENGTSLYLNGEQFELLQFHFHTFSEHTVLGNRSDLEMHAVFLSEYSGKIAAVSKRFRIGRYNPFVQTLINAGLPEKSGDQSTSDAAINLLDGLGNTSAYYTYQGSLTTPPCSEIVSWFLLKSEGSVSYAQYKAFRDILGNNFRPLQDVNGRVVYATDNDDDDEFDD